MKTGCSPKQGFDYVSPMLKSGYSPRWEIYSPRLESYLSLPMRRLARLGKLCRYQDLYNFNQGRVLLGKLKFGPKIVSILNSISKYLSLDWNYTINLDSRLEPKLVNLILVKIWGSNIKISITTILGVKLQSKGLFQVKYDLLNHVLGHEKAFQTRIHKITS